MCDLSKSTSFREEYFVFVFVPTVVLQQFVSVAIYTGVHQYPCVCLQCEEEEEGVKRFETGGLSS